MLPPGLARAHTSDRTSSSVNTVEIGKHAVLLAHVVIYQGVKIGDNFMAHAHAVVREHCRIGNNVLLQNGVVIGADGFGFAKDDLGHWHKIPQPMPVVIEDDVEIQANSCIDRASVGETHISRGTKIDNLVQVGHGSRIGEHSLLAAQVGLAGSTDVGNNVILTGQVGVVGHCKIGDGAIVTPQSGVAGDIEAGSDCQRRSRHRPQIVAESFSAAEPIARNREGRSGQERLTSYSVSSVASGPSRPRMIRCPRQILHPAEQRRFQDGVSFN